MSTLTPNYNLHIPEDTDSMDDFFGDYETNMNIIDNNLGGGGGGGGDIYGTFVNANRVIASGQHTTTWTYTATEDCFVVTSAAVAQNSSANCQIDGVTVAEWYNTNALILEGIEIYLKKGQTFTVNGSANATSNYFVYGLTQGTENIFSPIIYSDTERCIGVWRDNKPLYQKTLVIEHLTLYTAGTRVDISSLGVDMCGAVMSGCYYIVSGVIRDFVRIDYQQPNDLYLFVQTQRNDTTCYVTIQYTKTADTAGSGSISAEGVPLHHYSTTEQVVGTWMGETLYEKSFTPTLAVGSNTVVHGISNFGDLVSVKGSCRYNNQNKSLPLPYVSTNPQYMILVGDITDTDFNVNVGSSFSSIEDAKITIQYTKAP